MILKNKTTVISRTILTIIGSLAVLLGASLLFFGFAAIVRFLFPMTAFLAAISACAFILIILPLSFIRNLRPRLAFITVLLSYLCGLSVWMYAFLVIIGYLGAMALFLFFLFYSIVPFAALALLLNGRWQEGTILCAGLVISYLMRFYGSWLETKIFESESSSRDFIDVEAKII